MAKQRPWKVGQHDTFEQLDDDLWHVTAEVPGMPFNRHMAVIRLSTGKLVIHNAVCLNEDSMTELEKLGDPAYMIVPNHYHRIDAFAYKQRFPQLAVHTPAPCVGKIKVVEVDGDYDDVPSDPHLHVEMLDGCKEGVLQYTNRSGDTSLIFNDTIFNLPAKLPGAKGLFIRMLGSAGGPKVTKIGKMLVVTARDKLAAHLVRLGEQNKLQRIIPGHGSVMTESASDTLVTIARNLSPRTVD